MKLWITLVFFISLGSMSAQLESNIQEILPTFQKINQEYISEVFDFDASFDEVSFVGISSYHFDADYKDIKYRLLQDEQWSEWYSFSPQDELLDLRRTAYEGEFITASFSALQFKSTDELSTPLTVRLFIGKDQKKEIVSPQKSILCAQPEVCDRSCWCPTCPIDVTPQLTTPTHIIVHHSAGSNGIDLNFTEVVNYIWDLHVNTNGWDDIGYNWLIDPDGVIYEGRPDGYQGAHFSCINENTIGICLLGDFTSISPSVEAVNTLVNLVAYEATDHSIDVLAESYHETGDFTLANVAGHRDSSGSENSCSTTACPGETFYPMLDSIRIKVADLECYKNSTSIAQTLKEHSWSVYPNPFQRSLKIEYKGVEKSKVEIRDITGKSYGVLVTDQFHDLSHLSNGLYFVMYEGEIIEKVIKQE